MLFNIHFDDRKLKNPKVSSYILPTEYIVLL